MNVSVLGQKGFDALGLVRGKFVGDHVNFFATRLIHHKVGQERDELRGGMSFSGLAQDLAGFGI